MDANAIIRQVIAETLLVFDIALSLFLISYLRKEYCKLGWRALKKKVSNQAALAMLAHMTGLGIIRAWAVIQYVLVKHSQDPGPVEDKFQFPLVGLVLAVVGMSCCIRVFAPVRWGNWGWALTFMAAAGFVGYMQSYI